MYWGDIRIMEKVFLGVLAGSEIMEKNMGFTVPVK